MFLRDYCLYHARKTDAGDLSQRTEYKEHKDFLRRGYLFWEDHRFRPPENAALNSDGVIY